MSEEDFKGALRRLADQAYFTAGDDAGRRRVTRDRDLIARVASAAAENAELRSRLDEVRALLKWSGVSREVLREALGDVATESEHRPVNDRNGSDGTWAVGCSCGAATCDMDGWREHYASLDAPVLAPAHDEGSEWMTPEQAARYVAREAWPNERDENQDAWAPKLVTDREMATSTVQEARETIARRLQWLEDAARVLGVAPAEPSGVEGSEQR